MEGTFAWESAEGRMYSTPQANAVETTQHIPPQLKRTLYTPTVDTHPLDPHS
jgi:hypothetical protein